MEPRPGTRKLYEEREVEQLLRDETYRTRVGVVLSSLLHDCVRTGAPPIYAETIKDLLYDYGFPIEAPPAEPQQPRERPEQSQEQHDEIEDESIFEEVRRRSGKAGSA